jgi:hypothetical protein
MADDNRPLQYARYAIGEIVLVVIGILIALQINNWNENRKNNALTKLYIEDFIKSVKSDTTLLSDRMQINEQQIQNIFSILNTLETKNELSETELEAFFDENISLGFESYFVPEMSSFRQFEANNGGSLIQNKELRDSLYKYYMLNEKNEKNNEISTQLYQHHIVSPSIINSMISGDFLEWYMGASLNNKNFDLDVIRQNSNYISSIFIKQKVLESQNMRYQEIKEKAENLLELLESNL